ncbi:MAG: efflux RND transporter periplasmic adaptor subunit [Acidobacteriota bacterium]|nr:efflux RND transporter periplasmic adaptor subunit [Acidobacteriota bacterium]
MTARRADFLRVLRINGTTEALHSRPVLAPRLAGAHLGSMVITAIAPAGAHVRKGDLLVEFDRQQQYQDFLDKKASYLSFAGQVAQKVAAEQAARAQDDAGLKQAEDALATARLEVKKNEILSRIDAEINDEKLQEAEATLKQLRNTYNLKRQSAAAEIRSLQIQQDRARQTMLYAQANAQKMVIHSPMDGIVVLNNIWLNGRMGHVQEGTEVRPGVAFMRVVDTSQMDVRAKINQEDLPFLRVGQTAAVHLDAYPGLSFSGTLEQLAPLGDAGEFSKKVRTFDGIFSIQGSDPRLMPDLSAAVDVRLHSEKNALIVPVESVATGKDGPYVWLKSGKGFVKQPVRTGEENDLDIVIESGLSPGAIIRKYAGESEGASGT